MISLHISVWVDDQGRDRFKVLQPDESGEGMSDVTANYDMVALATEEGRPGFGVFAKQPAASGSDGASGPHTAALADQAGD